MLVNIGIFKPQRQWGPKRLFLLICFDDHSNSVTTNGKPTMLLFSLPGGPQPPPVPKVNTPMLVKNNKQIFRGFHASILIPSLTRLIIVLWRKLCPFKLVDQKAVTSNCLAVQLKSASNQELEIVFVRNPNDEKDKISNLSKAFEHLAENGSKNQIIIKDFNTSLNTELDYVGCTQDPHKASREFLHGLQDDGIFIYVYLTKA